MKKKVIAYLHTHWDREWYREFEVFRMRLLRVFDNIIDMLLKGKIPCFYFDGQTCALEDYLEIRPENKEVVEDLIKQKKLFIGPFYCLVDEFLTDKICFTKNIELGLEYARSLGCEDFIGYLPDTFGHSQNVVSILKEYGIDTAFVWRGCGDFLSEFKWCGINAINLVRGYFNDVFSIDANIEKKAELLKSNLDKLAEKSGDYILLPIGADHLGVECDISEQIDKINEILKNDYEIKLSSPFEYVELVKNRFNNCFEWNDELRDNSRTFVLQGCYSSRLDLKRYNIECSHKLDLVNRFIKQQNVEDKYSKLVKYAYKMLIKNQAHDSICGCSVDDVHEENIIRYKKILQIADTIIDELKFKNNFNQGKVLNLSDKKFSGIGELISTENLDYDKIIVGKGFDKYLLSDTQRIPITEDYTNIYKYFVPLEEISSNEIQFIDKKDVESDISVSELQISNSYVNLKIKGKQLYINNIKLTLIDYVDNGDSYNYGPRYDDEGEIYKYVKSKIILNTKTRVILQVKFEGSWDIINGYFTFDKYSKYLKIEFKWNNSRKNHLIQACFEMPRPIDEVCSEEFNTIIKREFDPLYKLRDNLPREKGIEAYTNTAPMQRGLLIDSDKNNIGIVTKGITQYEVYYTKICLPLLRATGVISNPRNSARSTPAGPPLETPKLQMLGDNSAELYVFFGDKEIFQEVLDSVYNYLVI